MVKLTNREKNLLIFLAVIIICTAYYQFIFVPLYTKVTDKSEELELLEEKLNIYQELIASKKLVDKEYKVANLKDQKASEKFLPFIRQERLILDIDQMIKETNIQVSSIDFSKIETKNIREKTDSKPEEKKSNLLKDMNDSYFQRKDIKNKEEPKNEENKEVVPVEQIKLSLSFTGTYNQILDFIKKLEGFDKKILLESLKIGQSDVFTENLSANIAINFYAIPKLQIEEEYYKWEINNTYGKDNPFKAIAGYSKPQAEVTNGTIKALASDFIINVNPITSDLPSVVMSKSKDASMQTYVFADNPDYENVTFQVFQKDNKYFYKYKTRLDSYPKDFDSSQVEFKPVNGEVVLRIYTQNRVNEKDNNGINLSLSNKSDLNLRVIVNGDDTQKPRIKIQHKEGNVSLEK
ncbi:type IV pilus assembly protein PilO [Desulfonispora thiosulfatigenes DSM 11270]|uniref:Type IV pilus assembly protein PilO n=1 Tax=Desulfonispora thiosulfatigenes DSM 11270 TaxID=656914 RepID=A0A1W1VP49_DESTI|nr:hypothetical protein [Desulfonispora thiosulfatigenes]SMB95010.1 type IV pilus assembly protein PilO [Desulfonispora thiosulfatigenes DSM 11270]